MNHPAGDRSLVSVVIPAYMAEHFIQEAIASVRVQSHRPIEVVVVEDCSPDRTAEIVQQLAQRWDIDGFGVRLVRQPTNMGGAAALARGFREAQGDYLCWLSADDAYVGVTKLTEQVQQLRRRPGISYARSFYRGPSAADLAQDELVTTTWDPARPYMEGVMRRFPRARLLALLFRNPINGSTVMIDRGSWQQFGNFDPALGNIDQDSDMWMRYSALGAETSTVDTPVGFYRIHAGQTSNLKEHCVLGAAATRIRLIMAYERRGALRRLLYWNWPLLALAHRWEWYTSRPLVADYLCDAGLAACANPLVRIWLKRMRSSLDAGGLVDARLAAEARRQADATYESEEFQAFAARLSR